MNWIKERLLEKSTQTAIIGLCGVILQYTTIPADINNAILNLVMVLLVGSAATKG